MATLIELYKIKVLDSLSDIYNGQIDKAKLEKMVDGICKKAKTRKLKAVGRNLYKYIDREEYDPNMIPDIVKKEHLNILSNGLFSENYDPHSSIILTEWMNVRKKFKNKMLQALEDNDMEAHDKYERNQLKVKQNTNSIYGASTMQKSFVSNVDVGGAITASARNFISEQLWAIEKFMDGNMVFSNYSEAFLWTTELFKLKDGIFTPELMSYISYIPTPDICREKFKSMVFDMEDARKNFMGMSKSVFLMFENMSEWKRVAFFYANNPIGLFELNPKIWVFINELCTNGIPFINPYVFPPNFEKMEERERYEAILTFKKNADEFFSSDESSMMNKFYFDLLSIMRLMRVFCFATIVTHDRVNKYLTRKRRVCVLSDTDSCMPTMYNLIKQTLRVINREDLMDDELVTTKVAMIYTYFVSDLLDEACMLFALKCNSQVENREYSLKMKNEFFYESVLMYKVKKNYIAICLLDEGKIVPPKKQLAIIGRSLGGKGLNPYVSKYINDLLETKVLRAKQFDPKDILIGVHELKTTIAEKLRDGDKTFGTFARYNGMANIKNPESTANARASLIWNFIYPEDALGPGDAVYLFDTTLRTEEDLDRIDPKYSEIIERIRSNVFGSNEFKLDFKRFGLKTFAVPVEGDHLDIPEWIRSFICVDILTQKHLQPITALYSSMCLSQSKYTVNSGTSKTKKLGNSNLIRF